VRRLAIVVSVLSVVPFLGVRPAAAEVNRTLRAELDIEAQGPFAVENLAGSMRVVPGSGATVVAVATVYAEDQKLADSLRLEQVRGRKGVPTLRVRYPLDRHKHYRYPGAGKDSDSGGGWLSWLTGHGSRLQYDGRRVRVSGRGGVLLYADVEVQVPRGAVEAAFYNHVGPLEGEGLEGTLRFDTGSGNVLVRNLRGDITADTGSGDVDAMEVEGSLACDTGSGNCEVEGFRGDELVCDTGSGEVQVRRAEARLIDVDTGSGDVQLEDVDADTVKADTGSASVEIESPSRRLRRIVADTGSGDVRLRLGPDASFEARVDTGSGDIVSRYDDAEPILRRREVVGYRRGDGRIRIDVDTGSGDLIVEP
jgi:hypothetical protein